MQTHKAYRLHSYGGSEAIQMDDVPVPKPAPGQVLVAVGAAGVNALDWKIREGYVREVFPLPLPATLGVEFAGVVTESGEGASKFQVGDRVMGLLHGLGAYAQDVVVEEPLLARVPFSLSDVAAAALPISVLTAWQALHSAGQPRQGMTVLIHGAAGAVGGFAVQFARQLGATVIATASRRNSDYLFFLGANEVIDYHTEHFETRIKDVDLVLDFVGGETLDRSWSVLAPGGAIVSAAAPDIVAKTPPGARGFWLMTQPNPELLENMAEAVAVDRLRSTIAEVFGFAELPAAVERNRTGHAPGKIVVDFKRKLLHMPALDPTAENFTLINTFSVDPADAEELLDSLSRSISGTMRHQPGFVSASLHVSGDRTKVINYAQWRSQEDFDAMMANPEAQLLMQHTASIAKSYDPILCDLRRVYLAE